MTLGARSKGETRRLLRARRREIVATRDLVADGAAIAPQLEASPPAGWSATTPGTVLSYESLPHEPSTVAVNDALRARGHRVLVPITLDDMQLDWCDLDDPGRTPFGIDAPTGADLVLAPGLAVDRDGWVAAVGSVAPRARLSIPTGLAPGRTAVPDLGLCEIIEAARRFSARTVVATTTDGQREFLQSLGLEDAIAGIVSERDVVRRLAGGAEGLLEGPVSGLMTTQVHTCTADDDLHDVAVKMTDERIRHLPVVDGDGRLASIVSIGDVVKTRLGQLQAERDALEGYINS